MKPRTFRVVFVSVLGLCLLLTAAHFAYACYAYEHASIIQFIAKELW